MFDWCVFIKKRVNAKQQKQQHHHQQNNTSSTTATSLTTTTTISTTATTVQACTHLIFFSASCCSVVSCTFNSSNSFCNFSNCCFKFLMMSSLRLLACFSASAFSTIFLSRSFSSCNAVKSALMSVIFVLSVCKRTFVRPRSNSNAFSLLVEVAVVMLCYCCWVLHEFAPRIVCILIVGDRINQINGLSTVRRHQQLHVMNLT